MEIMVAKISKLLKEKGPRMLMLAAMVILLFFCIEILPFHFGPKHLPWPELIPHIKQRMPVIVLIAVAVALWVGMREQKKE
jgi:peptidoglycan/LPS O-acetylase OafA/YrhL